VKEAFWSDGAGKRKLIVRHPGILFSARADRKFNSFASNVTARWFRSAGLADAFGAGKGLPLKRKTRLLAHEYDITSEHVTITIRSAQLQKPITLCQLKSRARPSRPLRKSVTVFREFADQFLGHHR
jgi:hypothetical protein